MLRYSPTILHPVQQLPQLASHRLPVRAFDERTDAYQHGDAPTPLQIEVVAVDLASTNSLARMPHKSAAVFVVETDSLHPALEAMSQAPDGVPLGREQLVLAEPLVAGVAVRRLASISPKETLPPCGLEGCADQDDRPFAVDVLDLPSVRTLVNRLDEEERSGA